MIDITTIEVIKGGLIYAAEEMGIALKKSAYSPNIKERMDHSCAIFNHRRELIAQAEHIPVHLGSMALAVKLGIDEYPRIFEPGDTRWGFFRCSSRCCFFYWCSRRSNKYVSTLGASYF